MKRIIAAVLLLAVVFSLTACGYTKEDVDRAYREGLETGYDNGYGDGYAEGYNDGFVEADNYSSSNNSYSESAEISDRLNKVLAMVEDYPAYTIDEIYSALYAVWEYSRDHR